MGVCVCMCTCKLCLFDYRSLEMKRIEFEMYETILYLFPKLQQERAEYKRRYIC